MIIRGNGVNNAPLSLKGTGRKLNYSTESFKCNDFKLAQNNVSFAATVSFIGKKLKEQIEKPLTLIHMSDTHKSSNKMAQIKSAVDTYKNKAGNPLVIHSGDYAMGSNGIEEQIDILNKIGIDYATLGNHEFFSGEERLAKALNNSNFQTVISNLTISETSPLKELFNNNKLTKSLVKEIDGHKYGFIGAVTAGINKPIYENIVHTVSAEIPINAVKREVEQLQKQGVDRIILLSHLGYPYDKSLAEKVDGIDVILGGHSHIALAGIKDGVNLFKSPISKEPVLLMHSGAYGESIGVSHLIFNAKGILQIEEQNPRIETKRLRTFLNIWDSIKSVFGADTHITTCQNKLVEIDTFSKNKDINTLVNKQRSQMNHITKLKKPINGEWPLWEASEVCSLAADAIKDQTGAQIALIQPGAVRLTIPKGDIYEEEIKDLIMPFDTPVYKVKIKGKELLTALHKGGRSAGMHIKPGMLHVSGLKYTIDMKKYPKARVTDVMVYNGKGYEPLDTKKDYIVAYDEYLLDGGDDFLSLKNAEVIEKYSKLTYAKALINHIKKLQQNNEPLHKDFSDRINVINRPKEQGFFMNLLELLGLKSKLRVLSFVRKD